jgi:D-glycero-D-manno-heptose 1,7-bisphosphate phosphatase
MTKHPAVFLDKDGTLIEDLPYNVNPSKIRLARGAEESLPLLHSLGYRLIVVSNQGGVALGLFPQEALEAVEERLRELLRRCGAPLAGFYWCPHHPEGIVPAYALPCFCRKPKPGLLIRAAHEQGIDLKASWMIGDILDDVEAGGRACCRTVLLLNGGETEWVLTPRRLPNHAAGDLADAARIIASDHLRGSTMLSPRGLGSPAPLPVLGE